MNLVKASPILLAPLMLAVAGGAVAQENGVEIDCGSPPDSPEHHTLAADADTVHWGYFSKERAPRAVVHSGDTLTIETLTHHANDDAARMIDGDPGAESVFR